MHAVLSKCKCMHAIFILTTGPIMLIFLLLQCVGTSPLLILLTALTGINGSLLGW